MPNDAVEPATDLGDFILRNMEPILRTWEDFAREIWPGPPGEVVELRNDAAHMLAAVVRDIAAPQTATEQRAKSQGGSDGGPEGALSQAALAHALSRVQSGFDIVKLVSEFRALRAAVNRLWAETLPSADSKHIAEMLRFNEAIDQLVASSVSGFYERVERSRQLFLGMIAHDLRQPLNAQRMLVGILGTGRLKEADLPQIQQQITVAGETIGRLLADLTDFSSKELGGSMPIKPVPCDLGDLCSTSITQVRASFPQSEFSQAMISGELKGRWDSQRIRQVLMNLLGNAAVHGSTGPITLTATDLGHRVKVAVHNHGTAIPADCQQTIFDPLVRLARQGEERPFGSVGLGLHICRSIVEAHRGTIQVYSDEKEGTTFFFELPKDSHEPLHG